MIVERLPEFFSFVRKVQIIVAREMKDTETSKPMLSKMIIIMIWV